MKAVISPESIYALSRPLERTLPHRGYSGQEIELDEKPKPSRWERFKSKVTEVCGILKPVVETVIPFVRAITGLVNAFCNYQVRIRHREVQCGA